MNYNKIPIIGGWFNSQSEAVPVSSRAESGQPVSGHAMIPEGHRAQYQSSPQDPFQTEYGNAIEYKKRGNRSYAEFKPANYQKIGIAILGQLGNFTYTAELAKQFEFQKKTHAKLADLGFFAVKKIFLQQNAEDTTKFLADEPVTFRSEDQIKADLHLQRKACRDGLNLSSARVHELLKVDVERAEAITRQMVVDQDKLERDEHAKHFYDHSAFRPSEYLKTLIYFALIVVPRPIANFHLNGNLSAPDPSAGLIALWFPPTAATPLPPARPTAKDHPLEVERRERQAQENAKSHSEKLADKNLQVEKARKDAAELQGQIAENQARKAMASEALKAQLSGGTLNP